MNVYGKVLRDEEEAVLETEALPVLSGLRTAPVSLWCGSCEAPPETLVFSFSAVCRSLLRAEHLVAICPSRLQLKKHHAKEKLYAFVEVCERHDSSLYPSLIFQSPCKIIGFTIRCHLNVLEIRGIMIRTYHIRYGDNTYENC
ncbi:hypothetical protein E2C01_045155 [Portunus trituberculatus]|uniref:Uncharacterized protein n=1 Tax=Portunus trituberculatus TaxID=210409 RepID=A0A5B7FU65_PORTR|nr:hypothetical protein [Portunus trituberculatus]